MGEHLSGARCVPGPGQAFPIHLSTTVPRAPHFTDEKPMTYKGSITHSVSHRKQRATVGSDPRTDPLTHPVCSQETQEGGAAAT